MIRLCVPSIGIPERRAVDAVLKSTALVQGRKVAEFEAEVARYLAVRHAVAVNSGTSALHLSLLGLGIKAGDEVIVPGYTFPATANVVELVGARPVLVDIEAETFNINPFLVEKAVTRKTRAIIPVHLFGQSADMQPILTLARKYKLAVLEDSACVLGADYGGRKCGTLGHAGCFSFHPRKVTTTAEGGMVVTNDRRLADHLRLLRNHGMVYGRGGADFVLAGFNNRMTEIEAAIGLVQMKKIERLIAARQRAAALYHRALADVEWLKTPRVAPDRSHVFQAYVIQVGPAVHRGRLVSYLRAHGIEANIGTYALHRLTFYKNKYRLKAGQFPVAESAFQSSAALPLFEGLTFSQIKMIARVLRKFK